MIVACRVALVQKLLTSPNNPWRFKLLFKKIDDIETYRKDYVTKKAFKNTEFINIVYVAWRILMTEI